jgi:hypothetical protein
VFGLLEEAPDLTCPVCATHKERIESGEPWMVDGDLGMPTEDGIPHQPGYTILMAQDFPPQLAGYSLALNTLAWEDGYTLDLNLKGASMPPAQKIWLSREDLERLADTLGSFIKPKP